MHCSVFDAIVYLIYLERQLGKASNSKYLKIILIKLLIAAFTLMFFR